MKKLGLFILVGVLGCAAMNGQGLFSASIGGGVPVGDAGDSHWGEVDIDADYRYMLSSPSGGFEVGASVGYSHSFGKTIEVGDTSFEVEDVQFIPIAASVRYEIFPNGKLGIHVGYALGVGDMEDGGFYYSPRFYYGVSETINVVAAWRSVNFEGGSFNIISAGLEVGINL